MMIVVLIAVIAVVVAVVASVPLASSRAKAKAIYTEILSSLTATFAGRYIPLSTKRELLARYPSHGLWAQHYRRALAAYISQHNDAYLQQILSRHSQWFDSAFPHPLDPQQRRAVVAEEEATLVVASAGSGKTTTLIARLRYLVECRGVDPRRILLLTFTHKAAAEMTARSKIQGVTGTTFHKLALAIIGQATGQKPSLCENKDMLLADLCHELLREERYALAAAEFLAAVLAPSDGTASEHRRKDYEVLLPDMDGRRVFVRSKEEAAIAFALATLGVAWRYEEPYEHDVADATHRQYRPDFSIYYTVAGRQRRLYLEHYATDRYERVPLWFAKERGDSYAAANKRYHDGMAWKEAVHKKFGTTLLTTNSAALHYGDVLKIVAATLTKEGVPLRRMTTEQIAAAILPPASRRERTFLHILTTFVDLLKGSCQPPADVLEKALRAHDSRSSFLLQYFLLPLYERYNERLRQRHEVDFTGAILWATEICRAMPRQYDHILVDECQDLSIDRYHFLTALRGTSSPATLFCVGDDWQSIFRFTGSDLALFQHFNEYFDNSERLKIETTYRFGDPLRHLSSAFLLQNTTQVPKVVTPHDATQRTTINTVAYTREHYVATVEQIIAHLPADSSILLLGRYTFDDQLLRAVYTPQAMGDHLFYTIAEHRAECLTVHKAKGLEADYVILLSCNYGRYGFPSLVDDDDVLQYVLSEKDSYPYSEERRLFYVALTRARRATYILYDHIAPSPFLAALSSFSRRRPRFPRSPRR